jgi:uncharacterized integral membrane protein
MVLAIALGLLVGTLNNQIVSVDLLWVQLNWPQGLVLLSSLVVGLFIGVAVCWLTTVLPLRMQIRQLNRNKNSGNAYPEITDV